MPDVCPSLAMADPEQYSFSINQGEFMAVYKEQRGNWDCLVTCFFIDTAHNLMDYLETFNRILKVGGLWVNIGPLQWHYSDQKNGVQVQLSLEEVEKLVVKFGFEFRKRELRETHYTARHDSMLRISYESLFFSVVKVRDFDRNSFVTPTSQHLTGQ